MLARTRGLLAALIGGLAVAACGSGGISLQDAVPPPDSVPLPRPAPKVSMAAADDLPWPHHPEPVDTRQFKLDKAKCTNEGNSAPGSGSPEVKFYLVFTNCMHSQGYEVNSTF